MSTSTDVAATAEANLRNIYITAAGVRLPTSSTPNAWVSSAGRDTQVGSTRNDEFHSNGGAQLIGGLGDDTYHLWDNRSTVLELDGQGIDTIISHIWGAVQLPEHVENLVLSSDGATSGTGNRLNNIIIAGPVGATLNGLQGDDVLVGGTGADLFQVAAGNGSDVILGFTPSVDVIQLSGYGISSFSQLKSLATQNGADVQFKFATGEILALRDVNLSSLSAYDFGLKPDVQAPSPNQGKLVDPSECFTSNSWYVVTNVWNPGNLRYNVDYTINSYYNPKNLTDNTTFNWSFPVVTEAYPTVRAYPAIIFGPSPFVGRQVTDKATIFPIQVNALDDLTASYDVRYEGNTAGFDVAFDLWLTSVPNGTLPSITNEVMIWVHKGGFEAYGKLIGTYNDGTVSGKIYSDAKSGDWAITSIVLDKDTPKADISISGILGKLQALGIVSPSEYLASVQFGAEVVSGAGSLTINNLDLSVRTGSSTGFATVVTANGSGTSTTVIPVPEATDSASSDKGDYGAPLPEATDPASSDKGDYGAPLEPLSKDSVHRVFKGTAGDDKIYGGTNADQMEGETGNDTYYVNHAGDKIVETLHGGTNDRVYSNISHTLASHVEHLYAQGSSSIDLTGNSLTNTITGNSGANRISGGLGKDTLSGGAGKDVFAFDTKPTSSNRDTIVDFNVKNDSIWLDNKIFKKLGKKGSEDKPAQLKKNFFTIGDKAKDKNDYIIYNDKNGKLYYDADGSGKGKQVEIATLSKDLKMTHKDFFVI